MNVEGSPIFRRRLLNIRARDDTLPVLGPMFKLSAPRFLCAQGQNPYRSDREKTASAGLSTVHIHPVFSRSSPSVLRRR